MGATAVPVFIRGTEAGTIDHRLRRYGQSGLEVWDIVRSLVTAGTTILLTTQYLEEADALADRVAIIDHGKVIAEGTPGELKTSVGGGAVHVRLHDPAQRQAAAELLTKAFGSEVVLDSDPTSLSTHTHTHDPAPAADALSGLIGAGIPMAAFSVGQPSLDDVFLTLTGHTATDKDDDPQ